MNFNKVTDRLFKKVPGMVWDLTTGKIGLNVTQGIATLTELSAPVAAAAATSDSAAVSAADGEYQVSINPMDQLGMAIPAFAFNTPLDKVNIGDFISGAKDTIGWVVRKPGTRSLEVMSPDGHVKRFVPPATAMFDIKGVMVVQSLTSMFGAEGLPGVQGSLLPLLMLGGDSGLGDMEDMLPMLLMSGMGGAGGGVSGGMGPMVQMLLMKQLSGGGGKIDPMMLMMMSGGFGGQGGGMGGMNPMMLAMLMNKDESPTPQAIGRQVRSLTPPLTRL